MNDKNVKPNTLTEGSVASTPELGQLQSGRQEGERPLVHSNMGCHYRWPSWIERVGTAGLDRSMSRKGCFPDNAACEGVFVRLKNEMFYYQEWRSVKISEFIDVLNEYLIWYNTKRIKVSLGSMSLLEFRQNLGLVA